MKKIISSALAATLLLSTAGAAMAQPRGSYGTNNSYRNDFRGNDWRNNYRNDYRGYRNDYRYGHRNNNAGAAIGLGLGLFALGAIIASSQSRQYDRYDNGYYYGR